QPGGWQGGGGGGGGGWTETVWTCSECGCEIGRGDATPRIKNCPRCGVWFENTAPEPRDPPKPLDDQTRSNVIIGIAVASAVLLAALGAVCIATLKAFAPRP